MVTENIRKQLRDYKRQGRSLEDIIQYIVTLLYDEDNFEEIIIKEMKALGFSEDKIVECLECDFGFDTSCQKEKAQNLNELIDHLIKLIESDDKRFSFEFAAGGTMEIYDKRKEIGYAVHIAPIEYDKNGNATNL